MIFYTSTRKKGKLYTFSEAILKGIAEDGGLLVPETIPQFTIDQLKPLSKKSYQERAIFIFNLFQTDLAKKTIINIVNKAYSNNFDTSQITPVEHLKDNQYILELWHGPTSAFKDLALQIMPLFFSEAVKMSNKSFRHLILVATSGDTGKAALEGYKDKENISIIVFYPNSHVSKLQKLQMITQEGNNVSVYGLYGNFDVIQTAVKEVFSNKKFNKELFSRYQTILSSANSINWGRLIPQIVYHVSSYVDLVDRNVIAWGDKIDITVPTGNFGNILSAFYAKKMGLPIRRLICASNTNNVLTDFLQTGVYDITNRKLIQTPSPSMDILIASNIERLLYIITGSAKKIAIWMQELKKKGKFEVDSTTKTILQNEFYADWVSNKDCLTNISKRYNETKYLMDPHTSVAQTVAERYIKQRSVSLPVVICSTAHWAKFAKDIYKTLKDPEKKPITDEFKMLEIIAQLVNSSIPKSLAELKNKTIRHKQKCKVTSAALEKKIKEFLSSLASQT